MELAAINSPGAAFVAGLVTSLHCAGMCGPLACGLMPVKGDRADPQTVSTVYHVCRLIGYAALGALAGGIARAPLLLLSSSALRWTPWLLVVFFVALAFRWDRYLPKIVWLGRMTWRLQGWMRGRSRVTGAAALGFATPLLPCGPLYFLVALASLAGSARHGVEVMLAFGLGTVPLLWLAQTQFHWVRSQLSPLWLGRMRVVLALTTAAIITWRLRGTLGFAGPDVNNFICF
jgi:sulfite exporter TauE/SafE